MIDLLQNRDIPIFSLKISYSLNKEKEIFFSKIPWGEYKHIRYLEKAGLLSTWDLKSKVFDKYIIRSNKFEFSSIENLPAGLVYTIADCILHLSDSGTIPDEEGNIDIDFLNNKMNLYRHIARNSIEYKLYNLICLVYKAYTFEMLEKMPIDKILLLFAAAESHCLESGLIKEPFAVEARKLIENKEPIIKSDISLDPDLEKQIKKLVEEKERNKKEKILPKTTTDPNISYIAPKHQYITQQGGEKIFVPGISIEKNNKTGGFEKDEFDTLPEMSDEEALALQISMGLYPAGWSTINSKEQEPSKDIKEKKKKGLKFNIKR